MDAKSLKQKFKIGSHYKIERFGILFLVLSFLLSFLTAVAWIKDIEVEDNAFKTVVGYTTSFKSSLSKASGDVVNVFENAQKTKVFILLKFDSDSVPNISTDANMYRLLVTGLNKDTLKPEAARSKPTATLYMLGSSGYMGIMLHEAAGFPLQILQVIVRMDRNFVGGSPTEVSSDLDSSFRENDQFAININPGADRETVISAEFLDKETSPTVMDIYALAESDDAENEARQTLSDDLRQMELLFIKMKEYENRLESVSIELADMPEYINGDRIVTYFGDEELTMTSSENYVYPEGHEKAGAIIPDSELRRVLVSDYVIPGGYNFDWYNGNIHDGYIDDLRGDKSASVFLRDNRQEKYSSSLPLSGIKWYYTNGIEFSYDSQLDLSDVASINTNIQTLMQTWQEYYTLKIKYERQDLESLLLLERSLSDVETSFSINTNENNIWLKR